MTSYTNGVLETPAESADGIEINYDPRPRVRITNIAIINAVSVPGRHTRSLNQYQAPGAIYHDLLLANNPHNQSLSAAIRKIRHALDLELVIMKNANDTGEHYWKEVIYRQFLGSFKIHHVGGSVLPEAEDTSSIEVTLRGISIQDRGLLLIFRSYDESFCFFVAVTVEDIQHLRRRGVTFLRNHGETS
ncbi:hypothetical protein I7I51_05344 [Histoplasma capsulatum]|uniref:Uncharacterized protein n=1 Tax=Ajellomyces capsulatus TaxID=5037 RepID=A0A8A1M7E8_AJECA|nr:hypothetical protein I7I51_05344 [Histoplasma capsulatum]